MSAQGGEAGRSASVDAIDRAIIAILEQDGRRSFTAIADEVGLSDKAVRTRVTALQDAGLIRIMALCPPGTLGHQGVFLLIRVRKHSPREVAKSLAMLPATNHISLVSGSHDIYIDAACRDLDQCMEFLDAVRRTPGVDTLDPLLVRRMDKNEMPAPSVG